jgi:hypothetical protein
MPLLETVALDAGLAGSTQRVEAVHRAVELLETADASIMERD